MTLPIVQFTFDSAGPLECVTWLTQRVVAGQLAVEVSADVPGTIRVAARIADGIAKTVFGDEKLFGSEAESMNAAYADLADKFGIERDVFGGPLLNIGLKMLLEALMKMIADNFSASSAERSEAGCPCDEDCDKDCDETDCESAAE